MLLPTGVSQVFHLVLRTLKAFLAVEIFSDFETGGVVQFLERSIRSRALLVMEMFSGLGRLGRCRREKQVRERLEEWESRGGRW